jgi:hypothetical protein
MKKEWLVSAKDQLNQAKRNLVYAARAFEKAADGANTFDTTIKEIKETIGDLEMSVEALNEEGI